MRFFAGATAAGSQAVPIGVVCSFLACVLGALAAAQIWFPAQLVSRVVAAPVGALGPALLQMGGATMLLCMNVLWVLSVRPAPLQTLDRTAAGQRPADRPAGMHGLGALSARHADTPSQEPHARNVVLSNMHLLNSTKFARFSAC